MRTSRRRLVLVADRIRSGAFLYHSISTNRRSTRARPGPLYNYLDTNGAQFSEALGARPGTRSVRSATRVRVPSWKNVVVNYVAVSAAFFKSTVKREIIIFLIMGVTV